MFLWARLIDGRDSAALLPGALREGVAYVPGAAFSCVPGPSPHLRLCFATLDDHDLDEAARRLARALDGAGSSGGTA
jgi:DNA-binding transcriptional MocR family regulator